MSYLIKRINPERNKKELIELWSAVLKNPSFDRFVQLYVDNRIAPIETWLVFSNDGSDLVGATSVLQNQITLNGNDFKYGINCDMLMLKQHRTMGPILMALKALIGGASEQGYHFLLAMPNEKSQPVFKRVGYEKIGTAYRWSKVLRSEEKLARNVKSPFLQKTITPCIDLCLRCEPYDLWMKFCHYKLWCSRWVELDSLVSEADFTKEFSSILLQGKNPAFLKWRYSQNLCLGDPLLFAVADNRHIIGYVVYTLNDKEVIVQNIAIANENSVEAVLLLSKFINKMREFGHSSISLIHFGREHFEKILHKFCFMKREGRDLFVNNLSVKKTDSNFPAFLKKISWFEGDLDL